MADENEDKEIIAPEPPVEEAKAPEGEQPTPPNDPPPAEEPKAPQTIEEFNAAREKELEAEDESQDEESDEEADEETEDQETELETITFEESDDTTAFLEKGAKVKERYEDLPDDYQAYVTELERRASATPDVADLPVSLESAKKITGALDSMYETIKDEETGQMTINPAPVVELFRTDYKNEFPVLAKAMLASDSMKYQGQSMMEEFMIDTFGVEKFQNMMGYAHANIPLPTLPTGIALPSIVPETHKEAYFGLAEVKRFEIEGLSTAIADLTERLKDAAEYNKAELEQELGEKKAKLNAELQVIEDRQFRINQEREGKAREQRQAAENQARFQQAVIAEYNTEIFGMADAFSADLAPRLTFADAAAQTGLARDINTRVFNALAFTVNDDGSYGVDPMADYYANQLKEEGIKFDFARGRELLQRHHAATATLVQLKNTPGTSQMQIERAEKAKRNVMFEIKSNHSELLGQISKKYVKGTTKALEEKVNEQMSKKQAARPRIGGNGVTASPKGLSTKDAIKKYNQAVAAKNGDELYEAHHA